MGGLWMGVYGGDPSGKHACRDRDDAALHQQAGDASRPATGSQFRKTLHYWRSASTRAQGPAHERWWDECAGGGAQSGPRAIHEPTQCVLAESEVPRHLLMGTALHGGAQQGLALHFRECCEPGKRLPDRDPPVEVGLGGVGAGKALAQLAVVVAGHSKRVECRVVDDPVQPRLYILHLGSSTQCEPRLQQRLLQGVLGALV
jgi:hypothetical protein